jgi:hypothetical protein
MISPHMPPDTAVDRNGTEALLSDLAASLLRLPFERRTQPLHIRALELKRRIRLWDRSRPTEEELQGTRASIVALRTETEHWRGVLRPPPSMP